MIATSLNGALTDDVLKTIVLAGGAAVVLLAWIIATAFRRIRTSENRTALIGMMLQRGMNAEQIEQVLDAGGLGASAEESEDEKPPDARIVTALNEHGYESTDVEEVLLAAKQNGTIDAATAGIVESLAANGTEAEEIIGILEVRRKGSPAGARR